jgi:N-methylhydantoinase A
LAPVMSSYLRDTTAHVAELSVRYKTQKTKTRHRNTPASSVRIMQSNGGIISAEEAAREPVRTILSGPAGGVIGAAHAAQLAGLEKCISFDMGGTSTDVALLSGELHTTNEAMVAGLPVAAPMLEIHTVGAGGGSIARFDAGGALRVGPESAGAMPGPICYGRGTLATVTDAHAVLGHLGNSGLLGGSFSLAIERARTLMQQQIDTTRGSFRTVQAFAHGILAVANAVMEKAIRVISVERGHDPRDYTLIAFGGAGGLHACDLAAALELRSVLIPVFPGGLSALGILSADVVKEFSRTVLLSAEEALETPQRTKTMARPLQNQATRDLLAEGFAKTKMHFRTSFDMRYVGQAYDLNTLAEGNFIAAFHQTHQQRYGYSDTGKPVEIVTIRCRATGITDKLPAARIPRRRRSDGAIRGQNIDLSFNGKTQKANLYPREQLRAGDLLAGPAVVTEYSGTALIPPGWHAHVDEYGQLLLSRK